MTLYNIFSEFLEDISEEVGQLCFRDSYPTPCRNCTITIQYFLQGCNPFNNTAVHEEKYMMMKIALNII